MLDIGWSEFLVIGVVALVVVGPKELPVMFRTLGRFTAKARSMSREFTRAMEAAAKESGVGDIAKDLKSVTSPRSLGLDAMQNAASRFEKWDPLKQSTPAKPAVAKEPGAAGADKVLVPDAPVAADIGPNTAALAAERAEKRGAVIQAAQDRAAAGAATAAAPAAKPVKAAKPKPEMPVIAAVARAKAAPKVAAKPKQAAAGPAVTIEKPPRARSKAATVTEVPVAQPAKRPRKTAAKTGDA